MCSCELLFTFVIQAFMTTKTFVYVRYCDTPHLSFLPQFFKVFFHLYGSRQSQYFIITDV